MSAEQQKSVKKTAKQESKPEQKAEPKAEHAHSGSASTSPEPKNPQEHSAETLKPAPLMPPKPTLAVGDSHPPREGRTLQPLRSSDESHVPVGAPQPLHPPPVRQHPPRTFQLGHSHSHSLASVSQQKAHPPQAASGQPHPSHSVKPEADDDSVSWTAHVEEPASAPNASPAPAFSVASTQQQPEHIVGARLTFYEFIQEGLFRLGLAGIFLLNAVHAWQIPEDFARIYNLDIIAEQIGYPTYVDIIVTALAYVSLIIGVLILTGWRKRAVLAFAGLWLLYVVSINSLYIFG